MNRQVVRLERWQIVADATEAVTVTVCELPDEPEAFVTSWKELRGHVEAEAKDLLILNEAPFDRWFALSSKYDAKVWTRAVVRGIAVPLATCQS